MQHALDDKVQDLFQPRANAFGSGFAGPLQSEVGYHAWLAKNPDFQREALKVLCHRWAAQEDTSEHLEDHQVFHPCARWTLDLTCFGVVQDAAASER